MINLLIKAKSTFSTLLKQGEGFNFRIFLQSNQQSISFWHDINLKIDESEQLYNMGIEIPRNRIAKFEVSKEIQNNPIIFDTRKNKITNEKELRYYAQFPCFNYGFLPQTWESSLKDLHNGYKGDDDPLDVVEVGTKIYESGQIVPIKVIGAFCVLDQNEVDWKIIAINQEEAEQTNISNYSEFEKKNPLRGQQILNWFKYIKEYDGKKANSILFNEKIFDFQEAKDIINETHKYWQELKDKNNQSNQQLNEKRKQFNI